MEKTTLDRQDEHYGEKNSACKYSYYVKRKKGLKEKKRIACPVGGLRLRRIEF